MRDLSCVSRVLPVLMFASLTRGYLIPNLSLRHVSQHTEPRHQQVVAKVKVSARKVALDEQVDQEKLYEPAEAIALMKACATAKFVETAELHGNLNLDPKYNDQQIRTTVALPFGTGKSVRVAVLAEGPAAEAAAAAGADIVGMADLIEDISAGKLDFEVLVATPPAMPKLAKLGKVLGPKGLMPSPKAGTVSPDPAAAVKEFKAGKIEFRTDKQGIVHLPFGKVDFTDEALQGNLAAVSQCIEKNRPTGCKGKLWISAVLASSQGPAIKLDLSALKAFNPGAGEVAAA
eukprot:CAMPEP_0119298152 /NCGR_PEP_ID=MMETSP1333-20130426/357_1 /TAXON_ID=418940 /ORGANISM="Scyphosphaera apsteinii, Strain RCC1455" /LENGTH=288 /DNA_ID=CAMNT_0007299181 /DNA_START=27 /DNA_END=893 /DNA_ORIENTATION=-